MQHKITSSYLPLQQNQKKLLGCVTMVRVFTTTKRSILCKNLCQIDSHIVPTILVLTKFMEFSVTYYSWLYIVVTFIVHVIFLNQVSMLMLNIVSKQLS